MTALRIRRNFPRPDPATLAAFRDVATGPVCDSQGRIGAIDHMIKPVTAARRMVGTAVVVKMGPKDNLGAWAALELVQPGDVIVLATGSFADCAVVGDVYVGMARNAGAAGVVTDGLVRDIPGIDAVGIPVFARGVSPNSPWKNGPAEVGMSATLGGVTVTSGDMVVADQDGVVIVALQNTAEILANLAQVLEKEEAMGRAVAEGKAVPDWLDEAKTRLGVEYVD